MASSLAAVERLALGDDWSGGDAEIRDFAFEQGSRFRRLREVSTP